MNRIFLVAAICALWGCGSDPQSGGGGIEIPNGLNLTVNSADNKPAKGVAVRLLARESWTRRMVDGASVVLDSATTDSLGRVSFALPTGEGYWVEASTGAMGMRAQGDGPGSKTAFLAPLSGFGGTLGAGVVAGVKLRLAGTSRTAVTDGQGRFQFDSLPQSGYSIVGQNPGSRKLAHLGNVELGMEPGNAQGLANDTAAVVLDDFADGDNVWSLHGQFGGGYWWIAAEAPGIDSVFGIAGAWKALQTDGTDWWMGVSVDAARMPVKPWAGLGVDLGPRNGFLPEFSGVDNFRVQVRGAGNWRFKVAEDRGDSSVMWVADLPATTNWTTLRIAASSLAPQTGASEVWASGVRRVRAFMFETTESGKLDVREFAVEGASLADWNR